MDKQGILGIKELSKSQESKESPWNSDKDPENWMWKDMFDPARKTITEDPGIADAIEKDYEGREWIEGHLDAGGPAVGKISHPSETVDAEVEQTK